MDPLRERAQAAGIELSYTDTWGRVHEASDEALHAVLDILPQPDESGAFDAVVVVSQGQDAFFVRVAPERAGGSVKLEFQWNDDTLQHHWFWLPELASYGNRKRIPLPRNLRVGRHRIRLYWLPGAGLGATPAASREPVVIGEVPLIVAPERVKTCTERVAGINIALFGLRSARNWGCGDCTDLANAARAFAQAGAHFVALNPLHAIANRQPYNTSPYLPQSSLWRNFIYIDVERVPGYVARVEWLAQAAELRETQYVEYERVAQLKLDALWDAFQRFSTAGADAAFAEFADKRGDDLRLYAVYCAIDEEMHRRDPNVWLWTDWPEAYRDPRSPAVRDFARQHQQRVKFFQFLQWQVDVQLGDAHAAALAAGMKIGLYHDLALACDRFGADLWSAREFYLEGCRVGAPPDELGPSGQDWGFPPPNREAHRHDAYRRFALTLHNSARHGGALRIDHVMRFFRLYWIPNALTPKDGLYVKDYADEVLGVLKLESESNGFIVIGEDLGTVQDEVRRELERSGILGIRLLWFEKHGDGRYRAPHEYTANAAAAVTTHDLATVRGFFEGRDIQERLDAGLIDAQGFDAQRDSRGRDIDGINRALAESGHADDPLGFILSTPSTLAVVNLEDLTGEVEQQNLPASTWQRPNWRVKSTVPVEDFPALLETLRDRLARAGRA